MSHSHNDLDGSFPIVGQNDLMPAKCQDIGSVVLRKPRGKSKKLMASALELGPQSSEESSKKR